MLRKLLRRLRSGLSSAPAHPAKAAQPAAAPKAARPPEARERRRPQPPQGRRQEPPRKPAPAPTPSPAPAAPAKPWDLSNYAVPPKEGSTRFHDLDLPVEMVHAIADLGFLYCTPIQAAILPTTLKGLDAAGRAQTGTGKTAAFLISAFTRFLRAPAPPKRPPGSPRILILAPTRELVLQIEAEAKEIGKYTPFSVMAVFGGMDYRRQERRLTEESVDMVVATPGRLLDFHRRHVLHLNRVEILVIDEADRMLDMGFIPDVRSIVHATPPKSQRQTLFFSATLTDDVLRLSSQWTSNPTRVNIEPEQVEVASVTQMVYIVTAADKFNLLYNLITKHSRQAILVFANRRDEARQLTDRLKGLNIRCSLLSGEVPQEKRLRTLEDFREGRIPVVVATDVAGRGIHVEGIGHVINYTLPQDPEDYVHRIGRTGRAGATGTSISFACEDDAFAIPDIEKYLGHALACTQPTPELLTPAPRVPGSAPDRPIRSFHPASRGPHRPHRPGGRGGPGRRR